jgi:carbon-monoxide dehydrogenase small subunit
LGLLVIVLSRQWLRGSPRGMRKDVPRFGASERAADHTSVESDARSAARMERSDIRKPPHFAHAQSGLASGMPESPEQTTEKVEITLHINGHPYSVRVEVRKTLVDVIREDCGQTGTHVGCEHGVCGACTVILDDDAVRACLMFAVQADGRRIRTVEGLADDEKLHPVQEAFMAHHALQCGFCTPGFLMLTVNAVEQDPNICDEEILDLLSSNLCRCTGYQNIVKAVRATARQMRSGRSG